MIPENKKEAVVRALQSAFGVGEFEDIHELITGLSPARIFRIGVLGKPYLLRVITRTDAISDPARWYANMQTAADAGIAPRIWYMDTEERVSITDFIEARPFPRDIAKEKMPDLLRRLHALALFPKRINYLQVMDGFVQKFRESKILPEEVAGAVFEAYEEIKKAYSAYEEDLVSSHNDLKPENILYDGQRVWLVDWEAAFLNDRYLDLAVVANFLVRNEAEEKAYLQTYFGREATVYEQARFFHMSQLLHLIYASFLILSCPSAEEAIDFSVALLDFGKYHDTMWAGGINLADMDARRAYALVHIEQMRRNIKLRRLVVSP